MQTNSHSFSPDYIWSKKITRRTFLRLMFFGALILGFGIKFIGHKNKTEGISPNLNSIKESNKSKVVLVRHKSATDSNGKANPDITQKMLNVAMAKFTGKASPEDAWRQFVSPDDIVGIKVNANAEDKGPCTQPALAYAIARGLVSAGVKENNIIIWDKIWEQLVLAGYKINMSNKGIRCYGTNSFGSIFGIKKVKFLQHEFFSSAYGVVKTHFSKILSGCTAIINAPILKDHQIAGVTLSMKNFLGTIDNPEDFHKDKGNPSIADLNMLPQINKKYRLTICDALRALYHGGPTGKPQWQWNYNGIILGTDRVAIDYIGWQIIEEKRKEVGLRSLKEEGREPAYIATAADSNHQLGTNDPKKIDLDYIEIA